MSAIKGFQKLERKRSLNSYLSEGRTVAPALTQLQQMEADSQQSFLRWLFALKSKKALNTTFDQQINERWEYSRLSSLLATKDLAWDQAPRWELYLFINIM